MRAPSIAVALALSCVACTSPAPSGRACATSVSIECKPLFDPPTFQSIYNGILQPNCATGKGTCHTADAAAGGLSMDTADDAYAALLGQNGAAHTRVTPGDPACSLLVERLTSTDPTFHMPRGSASISDAALCTIVQWIQQGAAR